MGVQQSKEELLYHQVNCGNLEGIRALRCHGACLEWVDKEGRTPLILACTKPEYSHVVKTLVELGANVNAFRPGCHGGTPLHHAAKRGLDQTVHFLLHHGANVSMLNDDFHTALDLARERGHHGVVHAIESCNSVFSGWLRQLHGEALLESFAPQSWVTEKIWVVILPCPCDYHNHMNSPKFELAIYHEQQLVQPCTVIALWKSIIEEPKFDQPDPMAVLVDNGTKTRYKFLSAHEGDKQQLRWFYNTCRGMSQLNIPIPAEPAFAQSLTVVLPNDFTSSLECISLYSPRDMQIRAAVNASIPSATAVRLPPFSGVQTIPQVSNPNGWGSSSHNATHNGWCPVDGSLPSSEITDRCSKNSAVNAYKGRVVVPGPSAYSSQVHRGQHAATAAIPSAQDFPSMLPSAPSLVEEAFYDGSMNQLSNLTSSAMEKITDTSKVEEKSFAFSSCVICLDAPVEGACIPCGHMVGCMSCLNEIKAKKWGCPVCRAEMDQVIKLYSV